MFEGLAQCNLSHPVCEEMESRFLAAVGEHNHIRRAQITQLTQDSTKTKHKTLTAHCGPDTSAKHWGQKMSNIIL